jgi:hypothetical protein
MRVSRRRFLATSAAASASAWPLTAAARDLLATTPTYATPCALLDIKAACVLRESFRGYQCSLADGYIQLQRTELESNSGCRMAVVAGMGIVDAEVARRLRHLLNAGMTLLLESAGGYLSDAEFGAHRETLERFFDIPIARPVDLWRSGPAGASGTARRRRSRRNDPNPETNRSVPYVDYSWPRSAMVRDFSRVTPVATSAGEIIGRAGSLPVALKRKVGKGILVFLGSPIGPALLAGDRQARAWLGSLTAL